MRDYDFRCSVNLSPGSGQFSQDILHHALSSYIFTSIWLHFFMMVYLSLGITYRFLNVLPHLKHSCIAMFSACFWCFHTVSGFRGWLLARGLHGWLFWLLWLICGFLWVLLLMSILLRSFVGYLNLRITSYRCCFVFISSGVEQIAFAHCVWVLFTLYLAAVLWWLSHWRHWSVWTVLMWLCCPEKALSHLALYHPL